MALHRYKSSYSSQPRCSYILFSLPVISRLPFSLLFAASLLRPPKPLLGASSKEKLKLKLSSIPFPPMTRSIALPASSGISGTSRNMNESSSLTSLRLIGVKRTGFPDFVVRCLGSGVSAGRSLRRRLIPGVASTTARGLVSFERLRVGVSWIAERTARFVFEGRDADVRLALSTLQG